MHVVCPNCQRPIELIDGPAADELPCPGCGSRFSLRGDTTTALGATDLFVPAAPPALQRLGRFELLAVVGAGAFGTVYRARDPELDRTVAIKVPHAGRAGRQELERFLREARSAARLRHPNIVSVYEVGQEDGRPYLVSDFVAGTTLAAALRQRRPGPREAARLLADLADALHYAHRMGVVHRDVKPGNVLLSAIGQAGNLSDDEVVPLLTDFGLAKRVEAGDEPMTLEGQVLGTPAYMSPEQARGQGHAVDGRSDVYSLGVMLYEMLTGQLPFRGDLRVVLHRVLNEEPTPPRRLDRTLPRDLETVCLRAMAREPARRYQNAGEMAEDLRRFLAGEPVRARAVGRTERLALWARRNPVVAGLTLAVLLLLLAGSTVAGFLAVQWRHEAELARENLRKKEEQERLNYRALYPAQMFPIVEAWDRGDVVTVQRLLPRLVPGPGQEDLRGFEWYYLWRLAHGHRLSIEAGRLCSGVAFLDGGKTLLAAADGQAASHDPATGRRLAALTSGTASYCWLVGAPDGRVRVVRVGGKKLEVLEHTSHGLRPLGEASPDLVGQRMEVTVSPDGKTLAVATGRFQQPRALIVWDLGTGKERFARRQVGESVSLAFSPDSRTLAVAASGSAHSVRLLDVGTGKEVAALDTLQDEMPGVAFSPDGKLLACARGDRTVAIWDVVERKRKAWPSLTRAARSLAFSPDGKLLATGSVDAGPVILWEAATGRKLAERWGHTGSVVQIVFAPDGRSLATAGADGTARLWDVPAVTGPRAAAQLPRVLGLAYAPDGRTLATAGADHTVRLWEPRTGQVKAALTGHGDMVTSVAFTPDGKALLSGSWDSTVRVWDAGTGKETARHREAAPVLAVACAPDGKSFATGTLGAGARLRDAGTGRERARLAPVERTVYAVAFAPDGRIVAGGCNDAVVRFWDAGSGQPRGTWTGHRGTVRSLAFLEAGRTLAAGSSDRLLRFWDVPHARPTSVRCAGAPINAAHTDTVLALAASRDGLALASASGSPWPINTVHLWGLRPGQRAWDLTSESRTVFCSAFSPNGATLATGHDDGTVTLWQVGSNRPRRYLSGHGSGCRAAALSADGSLLAEARADFSIVLLDAGTRRERAVLRGHTGPVTAVAFSRDGRTIATSSLDYTVRVWDARSGACRAIGTGHTWPVRCVALSPDGSLVASGDGSVNQQDCEVRLWDGRSGRLRRSLRPKAWTLRALAFSPDGTLLAGASGSDWTNLHGQVLLWDTATGAPRGPLGKPPPSRSIVTLHPDGHAGRVNALAFSPDGSRLATGGDDHTVRVWDVASREQLARFHEHAGNVSAVAWSPDGGTIVSAGGDRTLRFWAADCLQPRALLRLDVEQVTALAFTPDGNTLAVGDPRRGIVLWRAATAAEAEKGLRAAGDRDSLERAMDYQLIRLRLELAHVQDRRDPGAAAETRRHALDLLRRLDDREEDDPQRDLLRRDLAGGPRAVTPAILAGAKGPYGLQLRGRELLDTGRLDEAILVLREAGRLLPDSAWVFHWLGQALARKGKLDEAIAVYHRAIRLGPDHGDIHYRLGQALAGCRRWAEAVSAYREASFLAPDWSVPLYELGSTLIELGREDEAVAAWQEALRRHPNYAAPYLELGNWHLRKGRLKDGLAAYDRCRQLAPRYAPAWYNRGLALSRLERREEAVASWQEAARLDTRHAGARFYLGRELLRQSRDAEAAAAFREVLRLRPDNADYLGYIGSTYIDLGRPREALPHLEQARRLKPGATGPHYHLGRALFILGRTKEAVAAYEAVLRLDANHAAANNNLAWLLATTPDRAFRDPARAVTLASRAVARVPGDANYRNTLGVARYRAGDWKGALADLEKAIALRGNGTAHEWFFLAMAHWQLGGKEQARRCYGWAVAWARRHGAGDEELRRFQSEAAALLARAAAGGRSQPRDDARRASQLANPHPGSLL